jgi:phage tail-like protein
LTAYSLNGNPEYILVKACKDAMSNLHIQPYAQFNFLVDLDAGAGAGPHAGFQEFSHLKITGLNKATDVTLKRGVIASSALQDWLDQVRNGHKGADRTVTIMMQNEEHKIVRVWKLLRARIIQHVSRPLKARTAEVAIEELIISTARIELA